jgi:hypothetical protein
LEQSLPQSLGRHLSSSRSLPQTCAELPASPKYDYSMTQSPSILNASLSLQVFSGASDIAIAESESTVQSSRGGSEHLQVLLSS